MTDTEFKKKWLPLLNKIGFKESFKADIESLLEQIFEDGFQAGYEEAISQIRYKLDDMESEE